VRRGRLIMIERSLRTWACLFLLIGGCAAPRDDDPVVPPPPNPVETLPDGENRNEPAAPDGEDGEEVAVRIRVTHIKFDHKPNDAGFTDALDIRADRANDLQHKGSGQGEGEWISGTRNEAALYLADRTVTVLVRLEAPVAVTAADIEARASPNGLRHLKKRTVQFVNGVSREGTSEYVTFTPSGNTSTSIKKIVDSWDWTATDVRIPNAPLPGPIRMRSTGPHTTYTVLAQPHAQWYGEEQTHPWVSALEFALVTAGADGKTRVGDAAAQFTEFVFSGYGLSYSGADQGGRKYIDGDVFDLTSFMTRGRGKLVACQDTAAAVHVLTNLVGGQSVYRHVDPFGCLQRVQVIGIGLCNNPFHESPAFAGTGARVNDDAAPGVPTRSYFNFHTWVELNGAYYDATMGPFLGTTAQQYFTSTIDRSTIAEKAVTFPPFTSNLTTRAKFK